jgi:SOS-response transcriptional repressor LexA
MKPNPSLIVHSSSSRGADWSGGKVSNPASFMLGYDGDSMIPGNPTFSAVIVHDERQCRQGEIVLAIRKV